MKPDEQGVVRPTGGISRDAFLAAANAETSARHDADDVLRSGHALLDLLKVRRDQAAADLAAAERLLALIKAHVAGLEFRLNRLEAPQLMGPTLAAKYLGVSRSTVYKMIYGGEIAAVESRDGFARLGLLKSELDSYMANRPPRQIPDLASIPKRYRAKSRPSGS